MAVHLRRVLPSVVVALLLFPEAAAACPICFGGVESPLLDSARLGVLVMALVTVSVLGAFGAWFVRLARIQSTTHDHQHSGLRNPHSVGPRSTIDSTQSV